MHYNLIDKLKPIYLEDTSEWEETYSEFNNGDSSLFWYGGAGFDFQTVHSIYNKQIPKIIGNTIDKPILPIMTDYSSDILKVLKRLYKKFDQHDFNILKETEHFYFSHQMEEVDIQQMIPLQLFDESKIIRKKYKNKNKTVIPDENWHCVYLVINYREVEIKLFYFLIENLTFWIEVIEKYNLHIDIFCALRVGGKSGSWFKTHDPKDGKLLKKIAKSNAKKPKFWIADDCHELRQVWQEIEPHDRRYYGEMHFFETNWKNLSNHGTDQSDT